MRAFVICVNYRAQLVNGGATDHALEVMVLPKPGFDLNATIFKPLEGMIARTIMQEKVQMVIV